jgi:hypothetical protein
MEAFITICLLGKTSCKKCIQSKPFLVYSDQFILKNPVTHFFMVLFHKYDGEFKGCQYCKFQLALFIKVLPNLTFRVNKRR